jgi:hypothetical protein
MSFDTEFLNSGMRATREDEKMSVMMKMITRKDSAHVCVSV